VPESKTTPTSKGASVAATPSNADKTVQVKGYTMKNGTVVKLHTRTPPRKRPRRDADSHDNIK